MVERKIPKQRKDDNGLSERKKEMKILDVDEVRKQTLRECEQKKGNISAVFSAKERIYLDHMGIDNDKVPKREKLLDNYFGSSPRTDDFDTIEKFTASDGITRERFVTLNDYYEKRGDGTLKKISKAEYEKAVFYLRVSAKSDFIASGSHLRNNEYNTAPLTPQYNPNNRMTRSERRETFTAVFIIVLIALLLKWVLNN